MSNKTAGLGSFNIGDAYLRLESDLTSHRDTKVQGDKPTSSITVAEWASAAHFDELDATTSSRQPVGIVYKEHKLSPDVARQIREAFLQSVVSHIETQKPLSIAVELQPKTAPAKHQKVYVFGGQLVESEPISTPKPIILKTLELSYDSEGKLAHVSRAALDKALQEHMRPGRDLAIKSQLPTPIELSGLATRL